MNPLAIAAGFVIAVIGLVIVGLQVRPAPFEPFAPGQPELETTTLPEGLPAPVERFYRATYGEEIPVIRSAVVQGRGWMRFFNVKTPIRFRFTHEAGQDYRHDLDLTIFGLPFVKGFETFIDGKGWANTPGFHEGEGFDQGSNVSLWAEALNWFPAVLLTDERVEWRPVDAQTALLAAPFGEQEQVFVVRFDPASGGVESIETLKFKAATGKLTLWNNGVWADEGRPWIELKVEEMWLNVPVGEYIRAGKR